MGHPYCQKNYRFNSKHAPKVSPKLGKLVRWEDDSCSVTSEILSYFFPKSSQMTQMIRRIWEIHFLKLTIRPLKINSWKLEDEISLLFPSLFSGAFAVSF